MEDTQQYPVPPVESKGKATLITVQSEINKAEVMLTPERRELLRRTVDIRTAIGKVSTDSTELVRMMRESRE